MADCCSSEAVGSEYEQRADRSNERIRAISVFFFVINEWGDLRGSLSRSAAHLGDASERAGTDILTPALPFDFCRYDT
jgi:hypothetical protein